MLEICWNNIPSVHITSGGDVADCINTASFAGQRPHQDQLPFLEEVFSNVKLSQQDRTSIKQYKK